MELRGIPLHALVVHAAVVFPPLAALGAGAYSCLDRFRARLRLPVLLAALAAASMVWAAWFTGIDLPPDASEALKDQIARHKRYAGVLLWLVSGFALATLVEWERPNRATRILTAVLGAGTLVATVLTGHAGAHAVWVVE